MPLSRDRCEMLFVSTMDTHPWGGSEELWSRAAAMAARRGHAVFASVAYWPEPVPQHAELAGAGCRVLHRRPSPRLSRAGRRLVGLDTNPAAATLERLRPRLVVISQGGFLDGYEWAATCMRLGVPYVLVVQAVDERDWRHDRSRALLREVYSRAEIVCFVSQANQEWMRGMLAPEAWNPVVVRNPYKYDPERALPWPDGEPDELKLACVARLEPGDKGQDILFRVLDLEKWRARRVTVSLYGAGSAEEGLRGLAKALSLDSISFAGFASCPADIWRSHHVLVLPSRREGLPLALVEGMLCSRPAVVTDVGGNREVVEDGVTGFVAGAPTVPLLDAGLERAWQARSALPEMGRKAAETIRRSFPVDPPADFLALCLEAMDRYSSPQRRPLESTLPRGERPSGRGD